ncbi:hypothetical protein QR680_009085 [Steinernema hermaphroditum]|uniref:Uncharacterized protein n=1 Tax=Steinernema hermaphroditum TaxID=289476 RepID=A0AA39M8S9_9BILA|nr:hypothetical protein QR680_009085 [Steinernema hermaphroditum]
MDPRRSLWLVHLNWSSEICRAARWSGGSKARSSGCSHPNSRADHFGSSLMRNAVWSRMFWRCHVAGELSVHF